MSHLGLACLDTSPRCLESSSVEKGSRSTHLPGFGVFADLEVIAAYAHAGDPDHVAEVLERTVSLGTCGQGVRTVQVLWRRAGLGRPGRA